VVDVVAAEAGAHQLLEQVGLLVASLGRPEARERLRSMRVPEADERAARARHRLFPGRLAERGERVRRVEAAVRILRHAVAADQRLREALRVRDVVEAEAPLDAQPLAVRRPVAPLDAHDGVVVHVVGDLATDAAVRAHRRHLAVHGRQVRVVRGRERAGRARLHALAARDARGLAHRVVQVEHDRRVRAAVRIADHVVDLRLAARAHAARALDARVEVDRHRRMREVGRGLLASGETRGTDAKLALPGIEFRVELVDALRHVGGQQLDNHLLRAHGPLAVRGHLHAGGGRAAAGRREHALALDLDHAGAAVAVGPEARLVAEARDLDAQAVRDLEDGLAGRRGHVRAVQAERDRVRCDGRIGRGVHIVSITRRRERDRESPLPLAGEGRG
jgi:hypothetical protein